MTTPAPSWWPRLWDSDVFSMAVLGADRRYQDVNAALCQRLEADAETLKTWSYERVGHPLDLEVELDAFVRLAEGATAVSYARRFRSAADHEWSATVQVLVGENAQFLQIITPSQLLMQPPPSWAEQQVMELARVLSHDAQESVRQIGVSAGLLGVTLNNRQNGPNENLRVQQLLNGLEGNAVKLAQNMRGLAHYARLGPALIDPAPHGLLALVQSSLAQVTIPADITVHITIPATMQVRCDPAQISTALMALLRNACAPHAPDRPTTITVAAVMGAGHCDITVRDDGVGIASQDCTRLFRLFAASGPGAGVGIGLALVQAIAVAHRGHVHLESDLGVGTTMHLSIPQ